MASLRIGPDLAQSDRRRIICLRLVGTPLFWRVDLDIRATAGAVDEDYDAANPAARSEPGWSQPGSAVAARIASKAALSCAPLVRARWVVDLVQAGFSGAMPEGVEAERGDGAVHAVGRVASGAAM